MSKKIKTILFVVGIILLGILVFLLFFRKANQPSGTATNQPDQYTSTNVSPSQPTSNFSIPDKTAPTMTIKTKQGDIQTNNLYKNPIENLSKNGVVFGKSNDFIISFFPQDQGFLITLLNPDLATARTNAENTFLQDLNIPKDQACNLKVELNVPSFVNEGAVGKNYGLSFCPNGKALPKQ
ncbi:MAG: hypothetical protein WC022_01635 [Parcubacteria group bacterium]